MESTSANSCLLLFVHFGHSQIRARAAAFLCASLSDQLPSPPSRRRVFEIARHRRSIDSCTPTTSLPVAFPELEVRDEAEILSLPAPPLSSPSAGVDERLRSGATATTVCHPEAFRCEAARPAGDDPRMELRARSPWRGGVRRPWCAAGAISLLLPSVTSPSAPCVSLSRALKALKVSTYPRSSTPARRCLRPQGRPRAPRCRWCASATLRWPACQLSGRSGTEVPRYCRGVTAAARVHSHSGVQVDAVRAARRSGLVPGGSSSKIRGSSVLIRGWPTMSPLRVKKTVLLTSSAGANYVALGPAGVSQPPAAAAAPCSRPSFVHCSRTVHPMTPSRDCAGGALSRHVVRAREIVDTSCRRRWRRRATGGTRERSWPW